AEVAPHVYERPATPKRVTVLQALPVTAIGKIYKPALRLAAIETKLGEMLAPLGTPLQVQGEDRAGKLLAVLAFAGAADATLEAKVREMLTAIAVPTELRFAG
ncbi:MAG: acyl-CoA synthase, partial [Ramlibacter sp.]